MKKLLCILMILALASVSAALSEEAAENRYVRIAVKGYGDLYAEVYPGVAPITAANFMKLVGEGFYDGLTFHRVVSGFVIQGGDPLGNGTGGSKEKIMGEFSANGIENPLKHTRGALSMAHSADMNGASSQFFIMHADNSGLDGQYAAFGRVLSGMWIVDKICQITPVQNQRGAVAAEYQPVIESIREIPREEAEAARAAEEANGRDGAPYRDPMSGLSFPMPAGWRLAGDQKGVAQFASEADAAKRLLFQRFDQWAALSEANRQQLISRNITRKELNTPAFRKESLAKMIGVSEDVLQEATHSGILFYTAETVVNGLPAFYFIGAEGGFIYLFAFTGASSDPLFTDVLGMLDQISVE